jgi:hypothetical protein
LGKTRHRGPKTALLPLSGFAFVIVKARGRRVLTTNLVKPGFSLVSNLLTIVVVEKQHFFRRGSVFVGLSGRGLIKIISVYLTRHRPGQQYGLSETGRRVRRGDGVANSRKHSRGRVLCYINQPHRAPYSTVWRAYCTPTTRSKMGEAGYNSKRPPERPGRHPNPNPRDCLY